MEDKGIQQENLILRNQEQEIRPKKDLKLNTVSPLHKNFHIVNFQKYKRALTCLRTLSHACVGLYFCVLYRTVLQSTGAQCISSPGFLEASVKAVIAVAGTALPKHHWIVFSRADGIQSSKEPVPSTSGLSEISLSSACYC